MMVTKKDYSKFVFDYSSAFQYDHAEMKMKTFNQNQYKSLFTYQAITIQNEDETETCKSEPLLLQLVRKAIIFFSYILVISIFPISLWMCIKRVHALERLVLMRLGKLQRICGPGIVFVLPLIDNWKRVDLNSKLFTIDTSQLLTSDGAIIEAKTEVEYRVSNVLHYVTKLRDQENCLKNLSQQCLTNLVSEKDQDDLELHKDIINYTLKNELNNTATNWGLEVLNVFISSIKVLKAAEPVNALGTLISTLKAATGQSSEQSSAIFPFLASLAESNGQIGQEEKLGDSSGDIVQSITQLAESALKKDGMDDIKSTLKLEVNGETNRIIYCCFNHGSVLVTEDANMSSQPDVNIMLTDSNLQDFLTKKISPLQAYMDGKIQVTGDWTQLRFLSKVFQ